MSKSTERFTVEIYNAKAKKYKALKVKKSVSAAFDVISSLRTQGIEGMFRIRQTTPDNNRVVFKRAHVKGDTFTPTKAQLARVS